MQREQPVLLMEHFTFLEMVETAASNHDGILLISLSRGEYISL